MRSHLLLTSTLLSHACHKQGSIDAGSQARQRAYNGQLLGQIQVQVQVTGMKGGRVCRTTKKSKGIALIQFAEANGALAAKEALDGAIFQGRLLHVLPAHRPPPPKQAPDEARPVALPAQHTPGCVPQMSFETKGKNGAAPVHKPQSDVR